MSANELLTEALKLPPIERQAFAEQLWQSLNGDNSETLNDSEPFDAPFVEEPEFVDELKRRIASVQSGNYESLSFEESKALALRALAECKR